MQLAEPVWLSIQGEGLNAGVPVIFIRTSGCNVLCQHCDTKYSWGQGLETDIDKEIKRFPNIKHIIFTGGEPLLRKKEIQEFIKRHKDYKFEFETNGTISPLGFSPKVQFNVSPKFGRLAGKNMVNIEILKEFLKYNSYFKFVIGQDSDWDEMEDVITKVKIPANRVYIMPEGIKDWRNKMNAKKFMDKILVNNYRLSPRLQIWLWGKSKQR